MGLAWMGLVLYFEHKESEFCSAKMVLMESLLGKSQKQLGAFLWKKERIPFGLHTDIQTVQITCVNFGQQTFDTLTADIYSANI